MKSRSILNCGAAIAALLVSPAMPQSAAADELAGNPSLTKTWVFDAGAVFQHLDGDVGATGLGGVGGAYHFSRLGLDNENISPFLALHWRFADHWRFDFTYDSVDSDGHRGNSADLKFGPITIPLGYQLASQFGTKNYSGFAGYSFVKSPDSELGVRVGLTVMDAEASVGGALWVGNTRLDPRGPVRVSSTDLIPTIGIYGTYAFTKQLAFEGSIDGIAGNIDSYKGHYVAANAMLKYWFNDTFAVGAGYRYVDGSIEHSGSVLNKELGFNYSGLVTTVSIGF